MAAAKEEKGLIRSFKNVQAYCEKHYGIKKCDCPFYDEGICGLSFLRPKYVTIPSLKGGKRKHDDSDV